MACNCIYKKNSLSITHLPTVMLIVGYPVYWLELYLHKANRGVASPAASILFILISLWVFVQRREVIFGYVARIKQFFVQADLMTKILVSIGFLLSLTILGCALYASLYPPHLFQEYDTLNYHITVPRQHLILNSFRFLEWSSGDLFPLPVDFALAPYWLVTKLPNKFPQFIFLLGMVGVALNLLKKMGGEMSHLFLLGFAILGSHFFGIQMGTAMLDFILCYLFIAALDSFLSGAFILGLIEAAFFFWSKSFVPPQVVILFITVGLLGFLFKKFGVKKTVFAFVSQLDFSYLKMSRKSVCKIIVIFILIGCVVGGPFVYKSLCYSGTPLFPFAPGILGWNKSFQIRPGLPEALIASSELHMVPKDSYGHGKSLVPFIKHFWLIAIPEKGVNNAFDYPVGLPYLIFLGPFVYLFIASLRKKKYTILPFFIIIYWVFWWIGSQQTRFLYIPVILMFIVVLAALKKPSKVLLGLLVLSVFLNTLSVVRAHKATFLSSRYDVLRVQDKGLVELAEKYYEKDRQDPVFIDFQDAAFAQFPVFVEKKNSAWILSYH